MEVKHCKFTAFCDMHDLYVDAIHFISLDLGLCHECGIERAITLIENDAERGIKIPVCAECE